MTTKTTAQKIRISKSRIYRAVASSCAIETGETVASIERKLTDKNNRFSHLALAQ